MPVVVSRGPCLLKIPLPPNGIMGLFFQIIATPSCPALHSYKRKQGCSPMSTSAPIQKKTGALPDLGSHTLGSSSDPTFFPPLPGCESSDALLQIGDS